MTRDYSSPPWGLRWRSNTSFIIATVTVGLFTDLFLYGLVVPVLPFMLRDRVHVPEEHTQGYVSAMLAAYAAASMLCSLPAGYIADKTNARQTPFLFGLVALLASTLMLAVGQTLTVLILARILQGMSAAIVWTVGFAMILDTVGPKHLGKVVGSVFSLISVGELMAPVLGGVLYDKTGYAGVFGISAALLIIDFAMRFLIIEKKVAIRYDASLQNGSVNPRDHSSRQSDDRNEEAGEEDELLPQNELEKYKIPDGQNRVVRALPILYCLSDPSLLTALGLAFVQALLLATFDATIPLEAESLFGFSSLKSGLLFIALDIPYLALGTICGWWVDKYGTKPAAVIGFAYLVPATALLRLASDHVVHGTNNLILYCVILCLNGTGLAVIGSPSVVEASDIVQRYDKANPEFFGQNGPYAQLYGLNSLTFCAGLAVGPVLSGALRDSIGYGNMNAVIAGIAGITSILSFFFIGGKPKFMSGKTR